VQPGKQRTQFVLESPVVILCITGNKHKKKYFTFCPHRVFTCFVWTSQKNNNYFTAKLSMIVFTNHAVSVYRAVRPENLNTVQVNFHFQRVKKSITLIMKVTNKMQL
jgi:hypothetical protein